MNWKAIGAAIVRSQLYQFDSLRRATTRSPYFDLQYYRVQERAYAAFAEKMSDEGMVSPHLSLLCVMWLLGALSAWRWPRVNLIISLALLAWVARSFMVQPEEPNEDDVATTLPM